MQFNRMYFFIQQDFELNKHKKILIKQKCIR